MRNSNLAQGLHGCGGFCGNGFPVTFISGRLEAVPAIAAAAAASSGLDASSFATACVLSIHQTHIIPDGDRDYILAAGKLTFPRLVGEASGEADGAGPGRLPLPRWTFPRPLPSPLLPPPPGGFAAAAEPSPVFAMAGGRRLPLRFPEKEME
nr:unnamed protein product [Digitaria exilis]